VSGQERVAESPFSARCRDMGANRCAVDAVVAIVCHDLGQCHRHCLPNSGIAPSSKPTENRIPVSILGRNVAPGCAGSKPPEYSVDHRTVLRRPPTSPSVRRLNRQQVLQDQPFSFTQVAPAQTCLQKAALNQSSRVSSIMSTIPPDHPKPDIPHPTTLRTFAACPN